MSFGGPIDSMINAHKENSKLLGKRKRLKEIQSEYKTNEREPLHFKEGNIAELERFHHRLRRDRRRDSNAAQRMSPTKKKKSIIN